MPFFQAPTAEDGWGSWEDTDSSPVGGSAHASKVMASSMGRVQQDQGKLLSLTGVYVCVCVCVCVCVHAYVHVWCVGALISKCVYV